MKRFLSLFLVLSIFLISLVPNVSATSFDNGFFNCYNLLDYDTADGDNLVNSDSSFIANAVYTLPANSVVNYFDLVVETYRGTIVEAYAGRVGGAIGTDSKNQLTVLPINSRLYRIYGTGYNLSYDDLELTFVTDGSNVGCNITSCLVSNHRLSVFEETGTLVVQDQANGYDSYTQSSFGEAINHNIYVNTNYRGQGFCICTLHVPNWKKYDFVEIAGTCRVSDISSVIAWADMVSLPYNLTYLGDTVIGDISSGSDDTVTARRDFIITVDLRSSNRTIDNDYFTVVFECAYPFDQGGSFGLSYVHGINEQETFDIESYFFRNIFNELKLFRTNFFTVMGSLQTNLATWMTDLGNYLGGLIVGFQDYFAERSQILVNFLINSFDSLSVWLDDLGTFIGDRISTFQDYYAERAAILINFLRNNIVSALAELIQGSSGQSAADDFNADINDQSDELEDLTGDLNSVNRPDLDDVDVSVNGMVDPSVVVLATGGLSSILSNSFILRLLIMSLTLALAGFILFGKR